MDDLDLVSIRDFGRVPVLFSNYLFVELNGDALFRQVECVEEAGERGNAFEFACLAVDEDRHRTIFAQWIPMDKLGDVKGDSLVRTYRPPDARSSRACGVGCGLNRVQ